MEKLNKTDTAPDFAAEDYLGNEVNLKDYKSYKILLSFFRGASCPFCNLRLNQLIKEYPKFEEQGIKVISIFAASKEEILAFGGKQSVPFKIIADPTLELYKKYGIEESYYGMLRVIAKPLKMFRVMFSGYFNLNSIKDKPIIPADFLVDEENKIYKAFYGKDYGDHIPIQEILDW
jgi:peroxiredoxin